MTTCAYCRREYSLPPAECVGCGDPVPIATHPSVLDKYAGLMSGMLGDHDAVLNAQLDAINAASLPDFNPYRQMPSSSCGPRFGFEMLGSRRMP